jgi:hypothetical protein
MMNIKIQSISNYFVYGFCLHAVNTEVMSLTGKQFANYLLTSRYGSTAKSDRSLLTFQRCLLPPSSG